MDSGKAGAVQITFVLPVASMMISSSGLSVLANRNRRLCPRSILPAFPDFTIFQNGHLSECPMDVESNDSHFPAIAPDTAARNPTEPRQCDAPCGFRNAKARSCAVFSQFYRPAFHIFRVCKRSCAPWFDPQGTKRVQDSGAVDQFLQQGALHGCQVTQRGNDHPGAGEADPGR